MKIALRLLALALAAGSVAAEVRALVAAPGVVLILGGCAAAYTWFIAVARSSRAAAVPQASRTAGRSS